MPTVAETSAGGLVVRRHGTGPAQVALIGRNLTDKRYKVAGYPFAGIYPNTVTAFYGDPRTVKATLSVTF